MAAVDAVRERRRHARDLRLWCSSRCPRSRSSPTTRTPVPADAVTWTATVTDPTTHNPLTGSVSVLRTHTAPSTDIALDASGQASYLEPAHSSGYSEDVFFGGGASHGADDLQVHVRV